MAAVEPKPASGKRGPKGHRLGAWHQNARHGDTAVRLARMMREENRTYREIGQELGVAWRTVADWVNDRTRSSA